jgi:hypothetical protein
MPVSNEEVLAAIVSLKQEVQRIAEALEKQQERKSYQAEYYQKRKAAKAVKLERLENRNRHCLTGPRDQRLPIVKWTAQLKAFAERGLSAYNFITWLAWSWNHNTFTHVPITKSGGYMHVYIGLSGEKPLRSKYSERDVTGHMRVSRLTKPEQLDTFADALWWKWTFATICNVVGIAEEEDWFEPLGDNWHRPLKVAMGGFGCYEIKSEIFDHTERNLEVANKTYGWLRPTLEMNWNAFMRGLFSKEEPFTLPK